MTNRRTAFLNALLTSPNVTQAAQAAGISRTTAKRYMKEPEFQDEYNRKQADYTRNAMTVLQGKLTACAQQLIQIIEADTTPAAVKVQAIQTVFVNTQRFTEQAAIIDRMDELEKQLEAAKAEGLINQ